MELGQASLGAVELGGKDIHSAGNTSDTYLAHVTDAALQKNVVIQINGDYWANVQPDHGLVISVSRLNLLSDVTLNMSNIDVQEGSTAIGTVDFKVQDLNGIFSQYVGADSKGLYGATVTVWYGRVGVNMDFSAYQKLTVGYIISNVYNAGYWDITVQEITALIQAVCYNGATALNSSMGTGDTTMSILDATIFPYPSGWAKIGTEIVTYTGITYSVGTNGTLTGLGRAALGTAAATHANGDNVDTFYVLGPGTPMKLMLQVLISPGGGGPYDVLPDGCGIPASMIDTAGIAALDATLGNPTFTFYMTKIGDALTWIQDNITVGCGIRLFMKNGQISAAILNSVPLSTLAGNFQEANWKKTPSFQTDASYLTNSIQFQANPNMADGSMTFVKNYADTLSLASYKPKPPQKIYTINALVSPTSFFDAVASRTLGWLSTPIATIQGTTNWVPSLTNPADAAQVVHRYVPMPGAGLGISAYLYVLGRTLNASKGTVDWVLGFTNYSGIRFGLIAPTDNVATIINQGSVTITAGRGIQWQAGYAVKLWDNVAKAFTSDPTNTISSVAVDTLNFTNNWSTTLVAGQHRIRFCAYDDALISPIQKGFAFIAPKASEQFPDGLLAYKILKHF